MMLERPLLTLAFQWHLLSLKLHNTRLANEDTGRSTTKILPEHRVWLKRESWSGLPNAPTTLAFIALIETCNSRPLMGLLQNCLFLTLPLLVLEPRIKINNLICDNKYDNDNILVVCTSVTLLDSESAWVLKNHYVGMVNQKALLFGHVFCQ